MFTFCPGGESPVEVDPTRVNDHTLQIFQEVAKFPSLFLNVLSSFNQLLQEIEVLRVTCKLVNS